MKKILFLSAVVALSSGSFAQIANYHVFAAGGTTYVTDKGILTSTIGEMAIVDVYHAGSKYLTQGFQQGDYIKFSAVSLPVQLINFDGYNKDGMNHLMWETASEINNAGFDVERMDASGEFEKIGSVRGHGNTNTLIDYTLDDDKPLLGDNYYRLKQIDYDGHYTYSQVISIYNGEAITTTVSVYPVPVTDAVNVVIRNAQDATGTLSITNVVGAVMYHGDIDIYTGTTVQKVDMSSFAAGQYFVKVTTGASTRTIHVVKQ
ncbi:MAG: T9SS type A sorting domain-containing protein [Bacteroidetes bacterium]|nr:T9SS type A sorting domain-containing protein [Bacteroidota bacterium]